MDNADAATADTVKSRYQQFLAQLRQVTPTSAWLDQVIETFMNVTASYEPHLFHCYEVADLPRTNNDLEQLFGSVRAHQRRITGRKAAPASLVLYGPARLPAMVVSHLCPFTAEQLIPTDLQQWRQLRDTLQYRHKARVWGHRFRHDPDKFLADLEEKLLKLSLPP